MPVILNLEDKIINLIRGERYKWFTTGVNLGGVTGVSGGTGAPIGGFIGQLIQSKVTYDTTENEIWDVPVSGESLVTNLDRIRFRLAAVESGGGGTTLAILDDGDWVASGVETLDFIGAYDITSSGTTVILTFSGGGGGITDLEDLSDVVITSVSDNEVLAYDSGGDWINQTAAEAGLSETGHTHVETDITDLDHDAVSIQGIGVSSVTPVSGEVLVYNSIEWYPDTVSGGGGDTDTKQVKVSADDTTEGYLEDKIVAGASVTVTTLNDGSDEDVEISVSGLSVLGHSHVEVDITDLEHDAVKIQGRTVAATAPTDGQALAWNSISTEWEPQTVSGSSGTGLTYLVQFEDLTSQVPDTADDFWLSQIMVSGSLQVHKNGLLQQPDNYSETSTSGFHTDFSPISGDELMAQYLITFSGGGGSDHDSLTVEDTDSINLELTGQALSGYVLPGGVDHDQLLNFTSTEHFTEGSIDHVNIQSIGSNSHDDLDAHVASGSIHFTEESISHLNIQDIGDNAHSAIDSHITDTSIHFDELDELSDVNAGAPNDGEALAWRQSANEWVASGLVVASHTHPDEDVKMSVLGSPTYTTLEDYWDTVQSAGFISGGTTTDNSDGTVTVSGGTGIIKTTDSHLGSNVFFDWSTDSNVSLTDDSTNFVYVDYNAGSPTILATPTLSNINLHTEILISRVYRDGTDLHIWNVGQNVADYAKDACLKDFEVFGPQRAEGLVISETGTRNLAMTTGILYCAHNRTTQSALDTSVSDTFSYWFRDGGVGWTEQTAQAQINNANYDDGDGTLGSLTSNRYGVHWVYMLYDGTLHVQYGQGDYTLNGATSADVPAPPTLFADFGILLAKIVIQEGEASFADLQTAFETAFTTNATPDHGDLAGLADDDHTQYALADGSRTFDLDELEDTTITTPAQGESLTYDSGTWVNTLISGGVSGQAYILEDLTGQVPDAGDDFWLANTLMSGSLRVYYNGLIQQPTNYAETSASGFHTYFSPVTNDELFAQYLVNDLSGSAVVGTIQIEEDDAVIQQRVAVLNFEGSGLESVVDEGNNKVTVTVSGGGGAGHDPVTIEDTTSLNLELTNQALSGYVLEAGVDHDQLLNFETDEHFTEASIDHTNIANIGTNSHDDIDAHLASGIIHFTEESISHLNIQDIGSNSHSAIDTHITNEPSTSIATHAAIADAHQDLVTVTDTASLNLELTGQALSGYVLDDSHTHIEANITDLDHDAVKLQGRAISTAAPDNNDSLVWNGSVWTPISISGGSGTGETLVLEDVTNQVPDTGDDFFVANTMISGSLSVFYNGLIQQPTNYAETSASGFHTYFSPITNDELFAQYLVEDVVGKAVVGTIQIEEDDAVIQQRVAILNFEGDGVESVVDEGSNKVTVTISGGGGGGVTDHGALTGLGDDDHIQYAHLSQDETILGPWKFNSTFEQRGYYTDTAYTKTTISGGLYHVTDSQTGFDNVAQIRGNQVNILGNNAQELAEFSTSAVVFNDPGNNVDFRVKSVNSPYAFMVDAQLDRIFMGNLGVDDHISFDPTSLTGNNFRITTSGVLTTKYHNYYDGVEGPTIELMHLRGDAVGHEQGIELGDELGKLSFKGYDDNILYPEASNITITATELWTSTTIGAKVDFVTTPSGTTTPLTSLTLTGTEVVVNEDSNDINFRVESDTNENAFFIDGGTGRVTVGKDSNAGAHFTVYNQSASACLLYLESDIAAASSIVGQLSFIAEDTLEQRLAFGYIRVETGANYVSHDQGLMKFYVPGYTGGGAGTRALLILDGDDDGGVVINEDGLTHDFRVESTAQTDALKVDAGTGYVTIHSAKTTTGDPTPNEGLIYWNTVDNKIQMYADGAWRTLASW